MSSVFLLNAAFYCEDDSFRQRLKATYSSYFSSQNRGKKIHSIKTAIQHFCQPCLQHFNANSPFCHALIQTFRKPPPSNLESQHHDTFPRTQSGKVFLLHRHSLSSWTSLLLSIMIASITSCGVVSPLQADFLLSRPSQTCTGGLQRNMIAHEWIYPLIP